MCAFSNFVSATHRLPTLASREQQSRRTRFRSYQQVRAEGHFQFSGQRTRDQFCHKRASAGGAAGSLERRERDETAIANGQQAGVRQRAVTNLA